MILKQRYGVYKLIPTILIESRVSSKRGSFFEKGIIELSDSIKENGIIQPLIVRESFASKYEIIAGERRLRAALMAGFEEVPCIILGCDDRESNLLSFIENMQRGTFSKLDEMEKINDFIKEDSLDVDFISQKLGKTKEFIEQELSILSLPKEELDEILNLEWSFLAEYLYFISKIENQNLRKKILNEIVLKEIRSINLENIINNTKLKTPSNEDLQCIVQNINILIKSIDKYVSLLKISSINAVSFKEENEENVIYKVKVPKI